MGRSTSGSWPAGHSLSLLVSLLLGKGQKREKDYTIIHNTQYGMIDLLLP